MIGASVTVRGMPQLLAQLSDLEDAAADWSAVGPALADIWGDRQAAVLAEGRGWAPFSAASLVRHAQSGKPPMVDTGGVVLALTNHRPRYVSAHMIVLGPPKEAKEDSRVAALQHRGTVYVPRRNLRPGINAAERAIILDRMRDHLRRAYS